MNIYKKSFIYFTLVYVLFFTKTWGSVTGNIYLHDDVIYYAQAVSIADDFDVDLVNNLGPFQCLSDKTYPKTGKIIAYEPVGTSLLLIPPYYLAKPLVYIISLFRGVEFSAYDPLYFVIMCFFMLVLFYTAGLLLVKTLEMWFEKSIAEMTAIFALWGTILPVYVFRRPIFSVMPELFLVVLLVYFLLKIYKIGHLKIKDTLLLGVVTGFLVITRWNDIYILAFCFAVMTYIIKNNNKGNRHIGKISKHWFLYSAVVILIFIITQETVWISIYNGIVNFLNCYYKIHIGYINSRIPSSELSWFKRYVLNFLHILFGKDWGVLFTMPILLIGAMPFIFNKIIKVSNNRLIQIALLLLTFYAPFYVILQWRNTAGYYGYRILISLLPFSAIGFSVLIKKYWQGYRKLLTYLVICFCIFNFFVILPFELTEETTLHPGNVTPMGGGDWGNNAYFVNAVKFYFESDIKTLIINFARGYLGAFIFGVLSLTGMDLAKFGPKVKEYFDLVGYKQYISFVYFVLVSLWFCYLIKARDKNSVHYFKKAN